jgi:orotidine-5'-phosphate decarboxylase
MKRNPIFCAIDTGDADLARSLVAQVSALVGGIKLGLEFFAANGPKGVQELMADVALPLFLDLKFHDIPNTVAGALRGVMTLAPAFTTVHAAGGGAMVRAAVEEAEGRSKILAVTLLTSLGEDDLPSLGVNGGVSDQVRRLADLAIEAGADGLVCSPLEITALRTQLGEGPVLMVPGIRPAGADADDQSRILTPRQAIAAGASHLVIGRPITGQVDPAAALRAILASLETA